MRKSDKPLRFRWSLRFNIKHPERGRRRNLQLRHRNKHDSESNRKQSCFCVSYGQNKVVMSMVPSKNLLVCRILVFNFFLRDSGSGLIQRVSFTLTPIWLKKALMEQTQMKGNHYPGLYRDECSPFHRAFCFFSPCIWKPINEFQ